ncbi:MAG: hypothetical protein JWO72_1697 [Caulobacteraceae bacterium]|nr:hypothetical protein [Caulobacteraceae bacterium]
MTTGLVAPRSRPSSLVLALAALSVLGAPMARAAELEPGAQADLRRALAMVGPSSSEEPAVRQERQAREPSPGFLAGAALGAWINAAAQLDFDLKNPAAAGPPHVSQQGDDPDAILQDCADEKAAFAHLEERRQALGVTEEQVIAAAGAQHGGALAAWRTRRPAAACR